MRLIHLKAAVCPSNRPGFITLILVSMFLCVADRAALCWCVFKTLSPLSAFISHSRFSPRPQIQFTFKPLAIHPNFVSADPVSGVGLRSAVTWQPEVTTRNCLLSDNSSDVGRTSDRTGPDGPSCRVALLAGLCASGRLVSAPLTYRLYITIYLLKGPAADATDTPQP